MARAGVEVATKLERDDNETGSGLGYLSTSTIPAVSTTRQDKHNLRESKNTPVY
jgi:hypothetical protein